MNEETQKMLRAVEASVASLVEKCRKDGPLYRHSKKATAQVSRTGKWLLNAIATLSGDLARPASQKEQHQD